MNANRPASRSCKFFIKGTLNCYPLCRCVVFWVLISLMDIDDDYRPYKNVVQKVYESRQIDLDGKALVNVGYSKN